MAASDSIFFVNLILCIVLTLRQVESIDMGKYGKIDLNEEGFRKLCALELEAKREKMLLLTPEARKAYINAAAMTALVGAQLGISKCPDDILEIYDPVRFGTKELARSRHLHQTLCEQEVESGAICDRVREFRETNAKDDHQAFKLERKYCKKHDQIKRERDQFRKRNKVGFCDESSNSKVKLMADQEAEYVIGKFVKDRSQMTGHTFRQLFTG